MKSLICRILSLIIEKTSVNTQTNVKVLLCKIFFQVSQDAWSQGTNKNGTGFSNLIVHCVFVIV